jgi:uncharacterized protein involved in exopolysaccharide biosynthesis
MISPYDPQSALDDRSKQEDREQRQDHLQRSLASHRNSFGSLRASELIRSFLDL